MARPSFTTVKEYLAAQPAGVRAVLKGVRGAIRKALPGAEEVVSYQIVAFKLQGRAVLHLAGWKEHYSLYPATRRVITALRGARAPHEVRGSTLRFPLDAPVPVALIARLAKLRAKEEAERRAKKRSRPRKRAGP